MTAAIVVFCYLAIVLYVGIFAFRKATAGAEDYFVANRSLGTFIFLMSLFGTNMTSFSILGASGLAFRSGVFVYGLMASISAIVIPLTIFLIGTRVWAIGKKFGHITQVQIFRDRWEMGHIGTLIFALEAVMLVPYIIIGVMGGGETLEGVSGGWVPYWLGGLIVALVVMSYVFFGGMRGTAWVNTLQTTMFLVFGTIAFVIIARGIGGFGPAVQEMAAANDIHLARGHISKGMYFSYALIPLSSIMFPHIAIFCLTARKMSSFRKTVIFYPICIMALWLPSIFLGTVASGRTDLVASLAAESKAFAEYEQENPAKATVIRSVASGAIAVDDPKVKPVLGDMKSMANRNSDGVMVHMLNRYSPAMLAGLLGAAIMACVMASDSQILALSTMWAEDVYRYYGGKSEAAQVWSARVFVILCTIAAYAIAMAVRQYANIFSLAVQYAFTGYSALAPVMIACLFWRRSTKWGALASTLLVALCLIGMTWVQYATVGRAPASPAMPPVALDAWGILYREFSGIAVTSHRFHPVLPVTVGSAILMWVVSLLTPPPSRETIARYFPNAAGRDRGFEVTLSPDEKRL
jgi:SSS family solute:Na+ symporter